MRTNTAVHAGDHFVEHQPVATDQVIDGRLAEGAETVWTVTETLRKVYLV